MSEKKEQWVHLGYDNARQAYILGKYDGQALICTYTAWLNHRTHTLNAIRALLEALKRSKMWHSSMRMMSKTKLHKMRYQK